MSSRKILRVERRTCPHCDSLVSLKTYKAHKRRYFDSVSETWLTTRTIYDGQDNAETPPRLIPEPIETHVPTDTPGNSEAIVVSVLGLSL